MTVPLKYALRSIWVRRSGAIATVGGVALVVFVLASSQMLAAGLRRTLGAAGSPDKVIVMQQSAFAEANSRLSQSLLGLARAAPGVQSGGGGEPLVTGESVVQVMLMSAADPDRIVSVLVRGVSANVLELRPEVTVVAGRAPSSGTDEAMIGARLLERYRGLKLGGSVELEPGRAIAIVGVFESRGSSYESEIWADLDAVRTSLGWEGYLSSVTVKLASTVGFDSFARSIEEQSHAAAFAERESEYYRRVSRGLSGVITGLGGLIAGIFSLGAIMGAAITMYGSIGQRTREIGVFRALGFGRRHILLALLLEALSLASLGAAIGAALSAGASLFEIVTLNGATGAQLAFRLEPTLTILLGSVLAGSLVGLMGGLFPALQAARSDPLEAMRS